MTKHIRAYHVTTRLINVIAHQHGKPRNLVLLSSFCELECALRGETAEISTVSVHEGALRRTGKQHPQVLYIPTAKDDSEDYIRLFESYYRELGIQSVHTLRLLGKPPEKKTIQECIDIADLIYVNGGNTSRMLATWKRLGVDKLLREAHRKGTVIAGHSAGSVCWFSYGCSDSFYKKKPFKLTGMNVLPAVFCPHYDTEPVRQAALRKIMKRTPGLVGIAMDDGAVMHLFDDQCCFDTVKQGAGARRTFWRQGTYEVEDLPYGQMMDLETLFAKPN